MVYKLELSIEAGQELQIAECFFEAGDRKQEFLEDLDKQLRRIELNPFMFQLRYKSVRIISLDRFGYSVHYTIVKQKIFVLHIYSQHRDY